MIPCLLDSAWRSPRGFVVRLSLRINRLRTSRPSSKSRFRAVTRGGAPRDCPAVDAPDILKQYVRGYSGALALSQNVGLPIAVSAKGSLIASEAGNGSRASVSEVRRQLYAGKIPARLTAGSFDTVVIDRPGSQADRLQDPNFVRAFVSGVLLVRLGKRKEVHPAIRRSFCAYNGGWSILRTLPTLRVCRYIAGLAITSPANVVSVWGRPLRGLASNPPNQLYWLRSSWKLPWVPQGTPLGSNSSQASLGRWLEETSRARETLATTVRTSIQAKLGLGLICESGSLPEIRGCNCPLASYGSHPTKGRANCRP